MAFRSCWLSAVPQRTGGGAGGEVVFEVTCRGANSVCDTHPLPTPSEDTQSPRPHLDLLEPSQDSGTDPQRHSALPVQTRHLTPCTSFVSPLGQNRGRTFHPLSLGECSGFSFISVTTGLILKPQDRAHKGE